MAISLQNAHSIGDKPEIDHICELNPLIFGPIKRAARYEAFPIQRARKRFANLAKQDPGRAGQSS